MADTMREKLLKIVEHIDGVCPSGVSCYSCPHKQVGDGCSTLAKVDYLIASGVTVLTKDEARNVYTVQEIEELQNEAYDLGVESALKDKYGLSWQEAKEKREQARTESKWIPASEPPKEDGSYFVRTATGTVTTARFYAFKSFPATKYLPACHRNAAWQSNRNVTHWMPLPTPPKEE